MEIKSSTKSSIKSSIKWTLNLSFNLSLNLDQNKLKTFQRSFNVDLIEIRSFKSD